VDLAAARQKKVMGVQMSPKNKKKTGPRQNQEPMRVRAKLYQDGRFWLIECPILDALTQGNTKTEALSMMVDWVRIMVDDPNFAVDITATDDGEVLMSFVQSKPIIDLIISRCNNQ
jgi:predicted RNase H-like HicB family nuclease